MTNEDATQPNDIEPLFQQAAGHFQQGELAEADALAQRILVLSPAHAEANHLLGLIAIGRGDAVLAEQHLSRAIETCPDQPMYYYNLGLALHAGGQPEASLTAYDQALQLNSGLVEAHTNRGLVLCDLGRLDAAVASYERASQLDPGRAAPHYNRGNALRSQGQQEAALLAYEEAIRLNAEFIGAHNNRGKVLDELDRSEEALVAFDRLLGLNPDNAEAHNTRGNALCALGRSEEALAAYDQVLVLNPDNAEAHNSRGNALIALGRSEEALAAFECARVLNPDQVEVQYNVGYMLEALGHLDEAYLSCSRTLESKPGYEPAIALQINIRMRQGRYDDAIDLLEPLIREGITHSHIADAFVKICSHMGRCEEALALSRDICASPGHARQDLMVLHFSTGHALDRLSRFDAAFEQFKTANQLRNTSYDVTWLQRYIDACIEVHTTDPGLENPQHYVSTPGLIFIVGMPRSGTTLVEQILSSHSDVFGAGELSAMSDVRGSIVGFTGQSAHYPYCVSEMDAVGIEELRQAYLSRLPVASQDVPVVTDKSLENSLSVGLIRILFPEAKIIHCTRDPLDTCLSGYMNSFISLPYTYDLATLGQTWREYQRLMQHWQAISIPMMTLSYEALVDDQEGVSRRLLEYCGLQWDEKCLQFHKNKRKVLTVSFDQVNQPMYSSSVGRWRNYETHLGPLMAALDGKS